MPYVVALGGTYDLSAFSCYYPQQETSDADAAWGLYGAQADYSGPVLLASGYPDKKTAQAALEQMLAGDSPVRQFPAPPGA
jgi:hypothetical protein